MTAPAPSRRAFLAASAAAGLAASAKPAAAADPVERAADGPLFKLSLAAYSFSSLLVRNGTPEQLAAAEMTLEDVVDFAASLGLPGVELTGYYFPKVVQEARTLNPEDAATAFSVRPIYEGIPEDPDEREAAREASVAASEQARAANEYVHALSHRCFANGLTVSGTAIGNDFAVPPGGERDAQIFHCQYWTDVAAALGAPVIRIFAGKVPKGGDEAEAIDRCAAGINDCLEYAATKGVHLALENHGGITATPAQMLKIIERVDDSPWFGVNFDSGNFQTDDPYGDLAKIAPYAINAQIKPYMRPGGKKEEPDVKRVLGILGDAGYRGWVALEYEGGGEDVKAEVTRWVDKLRAAMG